MNFKVVIQQRWFKPALGAVVTTLCGLVLAETQLGVNWVNASYDYIFRFVSRQPPQKIELVVMDKESCAALGQPLDSPWDRNLHVQLLDRLTREQARLVVFDLNFKSLKDTRTDNALAGAMRRNGHVVLMADVENFQPLINLDSLTVTPPHTNFINAAVAWGIGRANNTNTGIARTHWPFNKPGDFPSLGRAAAIASQIPFDKSAEQQWLRYYSEEGPWGNPVSYYRALTNAPEGYFSNKFVFVGSWPTNPAPGIIERDKFSTPYTRWNGEPVGGVAIMATTFLNLINQDWLQRFPLRIEVLLLLLTGTLVGGILISCRPPVGFAIGAGFAVLAFLIFVPLSHFTNYWFPWLTILGGQIPCGLICMMFAWRPNPIQISERYPGYVTYGNPLGEGAYGKVWLVSDQLGMLHAMKEIERSRFKDVDPYDREFNGIRNYKPISNQHPGLLRLEFVYRSEPLGYFIYVMELGDPCDPDWKIKGTPYLPLDLDIKFKRHPDGRLPVRECLSIGITLADALDYLHKQGLTHRDIKPANIVFVSGQPKLADIGLVSRIRTHEHENTLIGTEGYMPPNDPPGTAQADIYALGKVLYVISTGKSARSFSTLPTELAAQPDFMRLNEIICKACHPLREQRYTTASELLADLRQARKNFDEQTTKLL